MHKKSFSLQIISWLGISVLAISCRGRNDVDLDSAKKLQVEYVDANTTEPAVKQHALFSLKPGESMPVSKLGTVDSTATSLANDYDGDGILNQNETLTNQWVADYPHIETSIAAPVTMKIEIQKNVVGQQDEIISQISSEDFVDNKNLGTESIHRNEVNERTAQVVDKYSQTDEESRGTEVGSAADIAATAGGGGGNASKIFSLSGASSSKDSWSKSNSFSSTTTRFPDVPFKNNLDRSGWSVKSDAAAKNARQYRTDLKNKTTTTSVIAPDAGYIRAALYIKNDTANIPVRISNILCSFLLEKADGTLIPVKSFRLRNEDYSLFSVDIYGGGEFGPYVIELDGLNTAEIEGAIKLGHNPKIFIVDYDMAHVPDSNYKSKIAFQGSNLKIIEENAKGRTALIKIKGPQFREMYRVAAFSVSDTEGAICPDNPNTPGPDACPGVPLRTVLQRVQNFQNGVGNATNITFKDFYLDFGESFEELQLQFPINKIYMRGIEAVGETASRVPCSVEAPGIQDVFGGIHPGCKMKPFSQWTASEKENFGMWVIFSDSTYYSHSLIDENEFNDGSGPYKVLSGIDSTVWAGDHFDIVYMTVKDLIAFQKAHGTNPLETGATMSFNTKWDSASVGEKPFDPDTLSQFLGTAGLGDAIELTFNLKDTKLLHPDFGANKSSGQEIVLTDFSYNTQKVTPQERRFNFDEAIDFEISLGLGGNSSDWTNILRGVPGKDTPENRANFPQSYLDCGKTLDYSNQIFKVCLRLPFFDERIFDENSTVSLFIRPALNNAYRVSHWPVDYRTAEKFQAKFVSYSNQTITVKDVVDGLSFVQSGEVLVWGSQGSAEIIGSAVELGDGTVQIPVTTPASLPSVNQSVGIRFSEPSPLWALKSDEITIPGTFGGPDTYENFFLSWNKTRTDSSELLLTGNPDCSLNFSNPLCVGEKADSIYGMDFTWANYLGNNNFTYDWSDKNKLPDDLFGNLLSFNSGESFQFSVPNYPFDFDLIDKPISLVNQTILLISAGKMKFLDASGSFARSATLEWAMPDNSAYQFHVVHFSNIEFSAKDKVILIAHNLADNTLYYKTLTFDETHVLPVSESAWVFIPSFNSPYNQPEFFEFYQVVSSTIENAGNRYGNILILHAGSTGLIFLDSLNIFSNSVINPPHLMFQKDGWNSGNNCGGTFGGNCTGFSPIDLIDIKVIPEAIVQTQAKYLISWHLKFLVFPPNPQASEFYQFYGEPIISTNSIIPPFPIFLGQTNTQGNLSPVTTVPVDIKNDNEHLYLLYNTQYFRFNRNLSRVDNTSFNTPAYYLYLQEGTNFENGSYQIKYKNALPSGTSLQILYTRQSLNNQNQLVGPIDLRYRIMQPGGVVTTQTTIGSDLDLRDQTMRVFGQHEYILHSRNDLIFYRAFDDGSVNSRRINTYRNPTGNEKIYSDFFTWRDQKLGINYLSRIDEANTLPKPKFKTLFFQSPLIERNYTVTSKLK